MKCSKEDSTSANDSNPTVCEEFDDEILSQRILSESTLEEVESILQNNEQKMESLQSEIQSLVYQNYDGFIEISDVLSEIADLALKIDGEVVSMKESVKEIFNGVGNLENVVKGHANDLHQDNKNFTIEPKTEPDSDTGDQGIHVEIQEELNS